MLRHAVLLTAGLTMVAACGGRDDADTVADDDTLASQPVTPPLDPIAHVALVPTAGNTATGTLMLTERPSGVAIVGNISGLRPDSELAFHVHETGDCSAPDATSAGEHFNPTGAPHGDPDSDTSHLGDLPNIEANDDGVADVDVVVDDASLTGPEDRSLLNRAIVVHAAADDYKTQPAGGSGARIACGVIAGDARTAGSPGVDSQQQ